MSMCLSVIISKISPIRPASVSTLRVARQKELVVMLFLRPQEGVLPGRASSSGEAATVAAAGPCAGVVASEVVRRQRDAGELPLPAGGGERPSPFLSAPAGFGLVDQLSVDSPRVRDAAAHLGALLKGADGAREVRQELEVRDLAEAAFSGWGGAGPVRASVDSMTEATDVAPAMYVNPRMASTGGKERGGRSQGGTESGLLGRWGAHLTPEKVIQPHKVVGGSGRIPQGDGSARDPSPGAGRTVAVANGTRKPLWKGGKRVIDLNGAVAMVLHAGEDPGKFGPCAGSGAKRSARNGNGVG
jgi:hypothetical protein